MTLTVGETAEFAIRPEHLRYFDLKSGLKMAAA